MDTNTAEKTLPVETGSAVVDLINTQNQIIKDLRARNEALEFVASYAQDVINFWPNMTFRTIRLMIPKMEALKEALGLLK